MPYPVESDRSIRNRKRRGVVVRSFRNESDRFFYKLVKDTCRYLDPKWQSPPTGEVMDPEKMHTMVKLLIEKKKKIKEEKKMRKKRNREENKEKMRKKRKEEKLISSDYLKSSSNDQHIGLYCEPPTPAVVEEGREVMDSPQRCYHHHVCNQVESDMCDLLEGKPQPKRLLEELEMQEAVTRAYLEKEKKDKEMKEKKDKEMKEKMTEKEKSEGHDYAEKIEDTSTRLQVFGDPWVLPSIKIGEIFDIPKLLSSSSRDYLIKSNQEQVKITDQLLDKYVILFLYALHNDYTPDFTEGTLMDDLRDIYNAHQDEFELVFVAFGKDEVAFDKSFFPMPWLAIPHHDQQSRDSLKEKFGLRGKPGDLNVVLFGPEGAVLNTNAAIDIEVVGPEGFPFTQEKLDQIYLHEPAKLYDQLLLQKQTPSLTLLLGEYVISSQQKKVHTAKLEARYTVGLYFFELGSSGRWRTRYLLKTWRALKRFGWHKYLKIIFINTDRSTSTCFSEDDFVKTFKCANPWYTLPPSFDARKLSLLFRVEDYWEDVPDPGRLIIFKPDEFAPISYFAFDIMQKFGVGACPFTLGSVVQMVKSKQLRHLKLRHFLPSSTTINCYKKNSTTTVSGLKGTRVLLLFATHSCYQSGSFLPALKRMYIEQTGPIDDRFEIIYISLDCAKSSSSFHKSVREMPWFVHPFDPDYALGLLQNLFGLQFRPHLPAIVAFGQAGHLETKESNLAFKKEWDSSYPFIEANMTDEVGKELMNTHKWDLGCLRFTQSYISAVTKPYHAP